jgi:hypothetical protein
MPCDLTSPAVEDEVSAVVAAGKPDVAVIDAMFPAALARAAGFEAMPVFVNTFVHRQLDMWRGMFARLEGAGPHRVDERRPFQRAAAAGVGKGA